MLWNGGETQNQRAGTLSGYEDILAFICQVLNFGFLGLDLFKHWASGQYGAHFWKYDVILLMVLFWRCVDISVMLEHERVEIKTLK